jgi:microcystin degradation protein MlrC
MSSMATYRLGIALFYHESHSFSPLRTDLSSFRQEVFFHGDEIVEFYRGTNTEIGGFLAALDGTEFVAVPLLAAAAVPAGQVTTEAYEHIREDMLVSLADAGELDGLLLALHGSMVVDDYQDPESDLIQHVRRARGSAFPIALTLDLHANVTSELLDLRAPCFGFQTYPHVDMHDQGVRAAEAIMRQIRDGITYYQCFTKLPALLPSLNMRTAEGPMFTATSAAKDWEAREGIVAASVFGGYPMPTSRVAARA